jgi:monoamine oxidase
MVCTLYQRPFCKTRFGNLEVKTDAIIIGGGVAGLAAAWQLHRHGVDVLLLEARARLGGRVLSIPVGDGAFDVGPSWVWHGQPCIAGLLNHFGISVYPQVCDGDLLHQYADGRVDRNSLLKPMQSALRITGGVQALVDAMAAEIPADRLRLQSIAKELEHDGKSIRVHCEVEGQPVEFASDQIAIAVPPRLVAGFSFRPELKDETMKLLKQTPTWMAGHAKYFAFYETPFWRDAGLSGDVLSRRGPLAEIHDASPSSGGPFALMGFFGIDGETRQTMRRTALNKAAIAQLVELFGKQAATPTAFRLVDWANEVFTASQSDRPAPDHHPQYGVKIQPRDPWRDRLRFISSENAQQNGGLLEGGLQNGMDFADDLIRSRGGEFNSLASSDQLDPHAASMSWDWIE